MDLIKNVLPYISWLYYINGALGFSWPGFPASADQTNGQADPGCFSSSDLLVLEEGVAVGRIPCACSVSGKRGVGRG